jgi:hypothetical protein
MSSLRILLPNRLAIRRTPATGVVPTIAQRGVPAAACSVGRRVGNRAPLQVRPPSSLRRRCQPRRWEAIASSSNHHPAPPTRPAAGLTLVGFRSVRCGEEGVYPMYDICMVDGCCTRIVAHISCNPTRPRGPLQ